MCIREIKKWKFERLKKTVRNLQSTMSMLYSSKMVMLMPSGFAD